MNSKKLTFFSLALTLLSCGVAQQEEGERPQVQSPALACASRPPLMRKSAQHSFSWTTTHISGANTIELDPGDNEIYLDWGTLEQTSETSATYTAPAFIPDSRKIDVVVSVDGKALGTCPVYLVADNSYGITDDGLAKGLVASVYPVPVGTLATFFPTPIGSPVEQSVAYNFNMLNLPSMSGITVSTKYVEIVFNGTIELPASTDYLFRLQANDLANVFIDGKQIITAANNSVVNSANLAYGLSAGKHAIKIEYLMTSSSVFTLKLEWAQRATATTFNPLQVVPYSAFDRQ